MRAGYIRVTHPCAGRRQVLLPSMPLDLHVLSLSLAFILSQDQTLRCSNCFFILSRSESKYILFLYFRILTVLFSCTTSCFTCKSYKDRFLFLCTPRTLSKNNTLSFFYPITEPVTGCKDKNKFLFEPNLFESFFWKEVFFLIKPICLKQIKKRTPPQKNLSSIFLQQALLSKAGAKVRNISFPYKYFMTFF